jgi:hypothetical protein
VVKSLRNWARAKERKAERRGRLEGMMDGSDDADRNLDDASAAVITSSISERKTDRDGELETSGKEGLDLLVMV